MSDVRQTRWRIVALCTLAGVAVAMQAGKAPPALGLLRAEFGFSLVEAGWVVSVLSATAAAIGVLAGSLSDRLGDRRTIAFCLLMIVLGNLMGAFAQSGNALLFSRFIEGIGFVGVVVSVPGIIIRVTTAADQRLAFGFWGAYMPFGMALMMAVAPLLLAPVGWRGLWLANAAAVFLFAVLFHTLTRDLSPTDRSRPRPAVKSSIVAVLGRAGPWLLGLCFMTYAAQWVGLMAWLPTFLTESMQYSVADAALLAALVVGLNVPGNWFGGWLLHQGITRWRLPALGCTVMGLCGLGIFSPATPDMARIGLALFFSFIAGLVPPTLLAGAPIHSPSPDLIATTNGDIVNCANIGRLLGPPAFGAIVAIAGGWHASGFMMAAAGGGGLVFAILLGVVERRQP
jgi:predicted MFS family arabinose efflux permease